jgi:hypothetical protein
MQLADWTSIAIIILAVEAFIFAVVFGVLFLFLNIGVVRTQGAVKKYGPILRGRLRQLATTSEQTSRKITSPIITVEVTNARARQWFHTLRASQRK